MTPPCDIFVSYAGDSTRARALGNALRAHGTQVFVAADSLQPGDRWDQRTRDALRAARLVVVLVSRDDIDSGDWYFHDDVAQAAHKAMELGDRTKVVPVLVGSVAMVDLPKGLAGLHPLRVPPDPGDWSAIARQLTSVLPDEDGGMPRIGGVESELKISVGRLPTPGPFFEGRGAELARLDRAWADPRVRVQTVIGVGGEGKSALVHHWLDQLAVDDFRGAARVYAWSFYSQGSGDDRQASADLMAHELLVWLGDPRPSEGDYRAKAERMARLLAEQRTLLILDGLEPLQHPPGPMENRLKDPVLRHLLRNLRMRNPGLCVVTSRQPVADIPVGATVDQLDLAPLPPPVGARVLRARGVKGRTRELEKASAAVKGHALALNLLGSYLRVHHGGDVRRRDQIPGLLSVEQGGERARRIMAEYDKRLPADDRRVLRLIGLFDRAAEPGPLEALLAPPAIEGLTDGLYGLGSARWTSAVAHLRSLGLLLEGESEGELDAHPLVREYFGEALRLHDPITSCVAHDRLFEYFTGIAGYQPHDLPNLEPLYRAIPHGCAAGRVYAAREVLSTRIERGNAHYSTGRLGALAANLSALSHFVDRAWHHPHPGLAPYEQSWILGEAAGALAMTGRIVESLIPAREALRRLQSSGDHRNASAVAGNLSAALLWLGRPSAAIGDASLGPVGAVEVAWTTVNHAELSGVQGRRLSALSRLASVCWYQGRRRVVKALNRIGVRLHGSTNYMCCPELWLQEKPGHLLETLGETRVPTSAPLARRSRRLLLLAQDRATMEPQALDRSLADAAAALEWARRSNGLKGQVEALLVRASILRRAKLFPSARRDLEEAHELAETSRMRRYLSDHHIEIARLALAQQLIPLAATHYEAACAEVRYIGYHLRDPDIVELAAALGRPPPDWVGKADIDVELPPFEP